MFKKILLCLSFVLILISCGNKQQKELKIAVAGYPMDQIVNIAADDLRKEGYDVKITKLTDYVTANIGLNAKDFDANFHQHEPFMNIFNKKNNGTLVKVVPVYDVYVGFYSNKYKNKNEIKNGAKIAIPNDPTNLDRALRILKDENLIDLKKTSNELYTMKDVINKRNFNFLLTPIPSLVQAYKEADLVFNWPSHMKKINVSVDDALFLEKPNNNKFAIILASREDNKDSKEIQDLAKAMRSDKVKQFLKENYSKEGYPVF